MGYGTFQEYCTIVVANTKVGGVVVWIVDDAQKTGENHVTRSNKHYISGNFGFNLYDTIIYKKKGVNYPHPDMYYKCWEYMFIFSKGKPQHVNLLKDRKNKWIGEN